MTAWIRMIPLEEATGTLAAAYAKVTTPHGTVDHHFTNARRLINDKAKSDAILAAMDARAPEQVFSGKQLALMHYAGKLTTHVGSMQKTDIDALHAAGCDDGEILEVNQVCAYFNYSNRLLNGLGVTTEGDVIGYYKENNKQEAA